MHYPKRAISLCSLLFALAACGEVVPVSGTQSDAAPTDNADAMVALGACAGDSIAIDDLLDCFVAAQCKWLVTCGLYPPTVQDCVESIKNQGDFDLKRTLESVEAERTIYDGAAAAECLAGLDAASCSEQPGDDCDAVFVGTIPGGGLCYDQNECQGVDARCNRPDCQGQCCAGSCLDATPLGGDCSGSDSFCADGDACVNVDQGPNPPTFTCYSGEQGIECSSDYHCDSGLYCGPSSYCVPALAGNAPCSQNSQCLESLSCVGEGAGVQGSCKDVSMLGASCDTDCDGNLFCDPPIDGTLGTCVMKRGISGSCTSNSHCQEQLYCRDSDSSCQPPPGLNMPCENYNCGPGLFCTTELPGSAGTGGVCAEPVVNGLECNGDSHCAEGVCANSKCEAYQSCYP